MPTNWTIPAVKDANILVDALVTTPGSKLDAVSAAADSRTTAAIGMVVARMRGAVRVGGRFPLSVTAGAVPPEAWQHAVVLVADIVTMAKPNMRGVMVGLNGVYDPFSSKVKAAEKWITDTAQGGVLTPPTDPTGQDYVTAVDADTNPAVVSVSWGDADGTSVLGTAGTTDLTVTV